MHDRRVCILHVGGTIGMTPSEDGFVPASGLVEGYLRTMQELSRPELPQWSVVALEPLLDSADMTPRDWVRIAEAILDRVADFDGFVVLHGTDTMAYTASALSFLLRGVEKPVILTGAQLPLSQVRSDGREHIITSLILAATLETSEVAIYFGARLLRGNRSRKVHNHSFVAFESGNLPPLAEVGVTIEVNEALIRRPSGRTPSRTALVRDPVVVAVPVYPALTASTLKKLLAEPVEGVVLETYGAGTFPTRDGTLLAVVADAVQRGVVVVNCSQCNAGRVMQELYGTSRGLAAAGVVSGHDMTPEAALTKLYCLLGAGLPVDEVRRRMEQDLAGEVDPR